MIYHQHRTPEKFRWWKQKLWKPTQESTHQLIHLPNAHHESNLSGGCGKGPATSSWAYLKFCRYNGYNVKQNRINSCMVRNFAYLSLYMPSSLDEKQCRSRLPVCRSPRSLFGHWSPDLRSWDFWKFGRQISPNKPYPTYPSMYIDRTHSLRYRWCIILKYQELSWVYITNCWMLFLSNELCSTASCCSDAMYIPAGFEMSFSALNVLSCNEGTS